MMLSLGLGGPEIKKKKRKGSGFDKSLRRGDGNETEPKVILDSRQWLNRRR